MDVTVCANCLCASCVQGAFYCDEYKHAATVEIPVEKLRELALESPHYWKPIEMPFRTNAPARLRKQAEGRFTREVGGEG